MTLRLFIFIVYVVSASITSGLLLPAGAQEEGAQAALSRFTFSRPLLGTEIRLQFYTTNSSHAATAASNAFERAEELNAIFSDYAADSEVKRLGTTPRAASPELRELLQMSRDIHHESGGAFDPTVGPLVREWRRARQRKRLPTPERLAAARALTGLENVITFANLVHFEVEGMRLDFGGIAKGYIADAMCLSLLADGIPRALVDAGGDLAVGDAPPDQVGWLVQIQGGEAFRVANLGLATSGHSVRFVEIDGVSYSHIVDPKTGFGVRHKESVTVFASSAALADGWASALSVIGSKGVIGGRCQVPSSVWVAEWVSPEP